jgi:hypothetical protein
VADARRVALLAALRLTVRSGLAGVWVRGQLPAGPGRRTVLLADVANVAQYRFARRIGAIGTDELRTALTALRGGAVLVIYPEGELLPAGPPGPLAPGAAWAAVRAPARLCPVAVRVLMRGRQHAEAYVSITEVGVAGSPAGITERLRTRLHEDLAGLDRLNAQTKPGQPLPGFTLAVRGRRSWDERVDAARGMLPWSPR